jgi:hypothetical protein
MLPKEAIEEFKKIYKQKFKKDLSNIEALRRANNLLNLYKTIYGPPTLGEIWRNSKYQKNKDLQRIEIK